MYYSYVCKCYPGKFEYNNDVKLVGVSEKVLLFILAWVIHHMIVIFYFHDYIFRRVLMRKNHTSAGYLQVSNTFAHYILYLKGNRHGTSYTLFPNISPDDSGGITFFPRKTSGWRIPERPVTLWLELCIIWNRPTELQNPQSFRSDLNMTLLEAKLKGSKMFLVPLVI